MVVLYLVSMHWHNVVWIAKENAKTSSDDVGSLLDEGEGKLRRTIVPACTYRKASYDLYGIDVWRWR
jgi:hypothetical protein